MSAEAEKILEDIVKQFRINLAPLVVQIDEAIRVAVSKTGRHTLAGQSGEAAAMFIDAERMVAELSALLKEQESITDKFQIRAAAAEARCAQLTKEVNYHMDNASRAWAEVTRLKLLLCDELAALYPPAPEEGDQQTRTAQKPTSRGSELALRAIEKVGNLFR